MSAGTTENGPSRMAQLRQMIEEHKERGWDVAWRSDTTPWDAGTYQPALKEVLDDKALALSVDGRPLVPGCGRGYDAICIAKTLSLETLGIDISPTAIAAAQEWVHSENDDIHVRFEVADFFALTGVNLKFDLVYDYTFFVAIPPARRGHWGRQMAELVKSGGILITLIFPIDDDAQTGPPYYVRPQHYNEVLGEGWEVLLDKEPEHTLESHKRRERIVVRRRL
ncbi:thiol methyltransferase 1 [Dichomitus squalens]|uniref:Thiol methyltransferase 1 n=1 Tax=Dichomitus squalens TaxID=114155 RepID=A0A4Q9PML1_9APHY|nr:thiol methyltransferase 1 [Dichomitus squalens]